MERKPNGVIIASASDNLREIVSSMQSGETLAISTGVYRLDRCIVVDKDVRIRSLTGNAADVTIMRAGATALLVKAGKPSIEALTFISLANPNPDNKADAGDEVPYESCVAVRGGSPTFVGCRASASEQSGFSVRGENTTAKFSRCDARRTAHGGVFFDGGATGIVEDCLFADNGLGCVDVEKTPAGKWVDIVRTKMYRSGYAGISVHDGGRVRASNCESWSDNAEHPCVYVVQSVFAAKACRFCSVKPYSTYDFKSPEELFECGTAFMTKESKVWADECTFDNLLFVFQNLEGATGLTMKRCKTVGCQNSIFIDPNSPKPVFEDCDFSPEPSIDPDGMNDDSDDEDEEEGGVYGLSGLDDVPSGPQDDDDDDLDDVVPTSDPKFKELLDESRLLILPILGMDSPIHVVTSGELCGFVYPKSRYGGTFVTSRQFAAFGAKRSSNKHLARFEVAMASRVVGEEDELGFGEQEQVVQLSAKKSLFKKQSPYETKVADMTNVLTNIMYYILSGAQINQNETLEFPKNYGDRSLAGRCFIFDEISLKDSLNKETQKSAKPQGGGGALAAAIFDYDIKDVPKEDVPGWGAAPSSGGGKEDVFGLLLVIEVHRDEMNDAMTNGGAQFLTRFKKMNFWPFSDLNRGKCF